MLRNHRTGTKMTPKLEEGEKTERLQLLVPASWLKQIDAWRNAQDVPPTRAATIRHLTLEGLKAVGKKGRKG